MTNKTVVAYELITELMNQRPSFNAKAKTARKNSFGRINNGYMYRNAETEGGWMVVNPLQTRSNQADTPIYAIYDDGSRTKINSHHFFSAFCDEAWIELKCSDFKISNKEGDLLTDVEEVEEEMWNEDRNERPTAIVWTIDATTKEKFTSCLQRGSINTLKSGKSVRQFNFRGTTKFIYEQLNLRPVILKQWPIPVVSDEQYNLDNPFEQSVKTKAAKSVLNAPITKKDLELLDSETEHIVIDEGTPVEAESVDEVNALFTASNSSKLEW